MFHNLKAKIRIRSAILALSLILCVQPISYAQTNADEIENYQTALTFVYDATLDDMPCYVVDVQKCVSALGHCSLGIPLADDVLQNGRSVLSFFRFLEPINNCVYISIPVTILSVDDFDFSDVKWASYAHYLDDGQWHLGKEFEYSDRVQADASFAWTKPVTIDGFTVAPYDAPHGYGPFNIGFEETSIIFAFSDRDSAVSFIEENWDMSKYKNQQKRGNNVGTTVDDKQNVVSSVSEDGQNGTNAINAFFKPNVIEAFEQYSNGNREYAKKAFQKYSALEHDPFSSTILGMRFPQDYNDEERFALFNTAAVSGYAPAIYSLALCYEQGVGVDKDVNKANELFQQAADILYGVENVTDPEVAYTIGQCYEYGDGDFEKNYGKAASWYARSSELGDPAGAVKVGKMFFYEKIAGDAKDMVYWFTRAKDAGEPEGTFWYAAMVMIEYADGDVEELMKIAADGGNIQAKAYLEQGVLYLFQE